MTRYHASKLPVVVRSCDGAAHPRPVGEWERAGDHAQPCARPPSSRPRGSLPARLYPTWRTLATRGRPPTKVSSPLILSMVHLPTLSPILPSETAPLLQDVDHPDADSRPQRSSFTSIIQEPLTPLTKVLLVVALLFLLLSSIFIGKHSLIVPLSLKMTRENTSK